MENFSTRFQKKITEQGSGLCIGLDPNIALIPEKWKEKYQNIDELYFHFCENIIKETADIVSIYKIQIAYFSQFGLESTAKKLIELIKNQGSIVILDSKRGDIAESSVAYAGEVFDYLEADATTLNPFMGFDTLEVYMSEKYKNYGKFILCKTSNAGSSELQNLKISTGEYIYEIVAKKTLELADKNFGLVMGATHLAEFENVRNIVGDMMFLVPGVGAQKADVEGLKNTKHFASNIINVGRDIIYDSDVRLKTIDYIQKLKI